MRCMRCCRLQLMRISNVLEPRAASPLARAHSSAFACGCFFPAGLRFVRALDDDAPDGGTALWNAIELAARELTVFREKHAAGTASKLRILCLTDGADTSEGC